MSCEAQWPLLEKWRLSLGYYWRSGGSVYSQVSHLGVKAIASHEAQSQGVMKNHNWNWRVILEQSCCRLTLLEAHLAGGYLCHKLLTFEPKVFEKVHPGAERSILRSGGSSSKAFPGAVESILGQKRLSQKLLKLILELCRLILEP